ncbi:hypothetical protein F5B17DRAFT_441984 [Nemania serpens]|nr:hypothetical protein F5B17DRAFT_441984 [Nemania serpens]
MLAIAPALANTIAASISLRNITQAYVQSAIALNRVIFAQLPKEIAHKHPASTIIKVTYHSYHKKEIAIKTSTFDPCLLVTNPFVALESCFGIVSMQTNNTLILANTEFNKLEEEKLQKASFTAKLKIILSKTQPLNFNGCTLLITSKALIIKQKNQGKKLTLVNAKLNKYEQLYIEQRACSAYIATAQTTNPDNLDQIDNIDRGLKYLKIDLRRTKLYVFVNSSFANNKDLSSQIRYITQVTRSVLASKIYSIVQEYNIGFYISQTISQIVNAINYVGNIYIGTIPLILCTNSYSFDNNPADVITKSNPNKLLIRLIDNNKIIIRIEGLIIRKKATGTISKHTTR